MKATNFLKVAILALPLMLASCGSKKKAVEETTKPVISSTQTQFLDKVTNNAQQARAIAFTPDQTQIAIPVREMFGDDVAIFPLWLEYINFSVDTKTTTGSHEILLNPIATSST